MNDALKLVCDERTRLIVTNKEGQLQVEVQREIDGSWLTFAKATKQDSELLVIPAS